MDKLRFGPGGFPRPTQGKGVKAAVQWCKEHELGCMEFEFVHNTWLKPDVAEEVKEIAKKGDITFTAHGSYYINLNAEDKKKQETSRNRVLSAMHALDAAGGFSVTFHPAFYLKQDPKKVYATVKEQLKLILKEAKDAGLQVRLSPETTGKGTQFGTYEELCRLAEEIEGLGLCVDFAHLHARTNGAYNSYEEFSKVLETVEKHLGREGLDNMHIHMSGIAYSEKGEKHHLTLDDSDMNVADLLRAWKDYNVKGCVISESPIIEEDALNMKTRYAKLK